jgi:hypothetical protein
MKSVRISIPNDSTLADVARGLKNPIEYVRNVLAALVQHKREGTADPLIRLSLQSDPSAPNYRIEEIMDAETGQSMVLTSYSGKTHRQLSSDKLDAGYWSETSSDFSQLQELIGMLQKALKK